LDGTCEIEAECVVSPNFPGAYRNSDSCTIEITAEQGMKLSVMQFSTEHGFDYLYVNGNGYSGDESQVVDDIEALVATNAITWSSDGSVEGHGWKICHGVEPAVHVTCDTVFDDLELAEGESRSVTCPESCADDRYDIWGSNPYTSDSGICKAAAHLGMAGGEAIKVEALGTHSKFKGSKSNGIRSQSWKGEWTGVSIS
jgi:hypothetical protein